MTRGVSSLGHALWAAGLMGVLAAAPVLAAPGDPFGGDDTGCVPSTSDGRSCAKKVVVALGKLRVAVAKCHLTQASHAFKNGSGTPGFGNAEENCEIGPSATSAKAKFDDKIASLAAAGCDATLIANAIARRDLILGDKTVVGSLDNLNATFFCDATSGNEIDPGGDDGGYIPATPENYKCSVAVTKSWYKLRYYVDKCHVKLADAVFKSTVFDEEACEDVGPKSALAKYQYNVNKYLTLCPSCLADPLSPTNALDLGTSTVADADATLQEAYICPGP